MDYLYDDNTPIIACSSGNTSNTGISLIRISGFDDPRIFSQFLSIDFSKLKFRFSYFCNLSLENEIIDSVVAVFFQGPNSFNGENILEISAHGNILNIEKIISLFIKKLKFRLSAPGEFTYRAYKNNKLSLSQVEGLDLLLNANSDFALKQGLSLLDGDLNSLYQNLHTNFLKHKSSIELSMDFYEDVGEESANLLLKESFISFFDIVKKLSSKFSNNINLLSPKIVLLGEPNAGKSTIFNKILNNDRSIVSNIEGTTRDYITEKIKIADGFYELIDTAGIRENAKEIESIGINKTLELTQSSFFNILLINLAKPEMDLELLKGRVDHIIFTHFDQFSSDETRERKIKSVLNNEHITRLLSGPIEPKLIGPMGANLNIGPIEPSITGPMGANLKTGPIEPKILTISFSDNSPQSDFSAIFSLVSSKFNALSGGNLLLVERHKHILSIINELSLEYESLIKNSQDISIISSEFSNIGCLISELIGIVTPEDVLQNIFTNFCIGK